MPFPKVFVQKWTQPTGQKFELCLPITLFVLITIMLNTPELTGFSIFNEITPVHSENDVMAMTFKKVWMALIFD